MLKLDHIAVACETLDEGRAYVEQALGVSMQPGGKHARFGTHNLLLGLADGIYFEVIAVDPDAPAPHGPRWFNMDHFSGAPKLTNWICQTDDMARALAAAPDGVGPAVELRRDDLIWQMAASRGGILPYDQCFPALISWGNSPHPSTRLAPSGARLLRLEIEHPLAENLRADLSGMFADDRISISNGDVMRMRAVFDTENGTRVLE